MNTTRSKAPHIGVTSVSESQSSVRLALLPALFKIQSCRKCTEWPQADLQHLTVKSTLYTLNVTPESTFWPSSLYDHPVYNSPLTPMLRTKKKKKKKTKIKNLIFHNSLNNFIWDPAWEYTRILELIWFVLSEEMSFESLTLMWSHNNKNEKKKKMTNMQNFKFHNSLKN